MIAVNDNSEHFLLRPRALDLRRQYSYSILSKYISKLYHSLGTHGFLGGCFMYCGPAIGPTPDPKI